MRTRHALLLSAALLLPSCTNDYPNPFANSNQTMLPSATADIVYTSNAWSARAGAPREIFAIEDTGAGATRLTFCNHDQQRCDNVEAAPAPDRKRMAVRKVASDTNGDSRLTADDGEALLMIDLARGVEGSLVQANARVSGVEWFADQELVFYSANGQGAEDLYQVASNGQQNQDLTATTGIRERRPRLNTNATALAFERIEGTGKGAIWLATSTGTRAVTSGGAGTATLPLTPYIVGGDADPAFSPDSRRIVFRRLTATGNGDQGSWDILTVAIDGTALATVATGPAFRGAPDWGPSGIVFPESTAGGPVLLVLVDPDGSNRRVLVTAGAGFDISNPRFFR